jgi:hypothetical protein
MKNTLKNNRNHTFKYTLYITYPYDIDSVLLHNITLKVVSN